MDGDRLVVRERPAAGSALALRAEMWLGRGAQVGGSLGRERLTSLQPAGIRRASGGDPVVEDLGSMNGTFVNGERVRGSCSLLDWGLDASRGCDTSELGQVGHPRALMGELEEKISGGSMVMPPRCRRLQERMAWSPTVSAVSRWPAPAMRRAWVHARRDPTRTVSCLALVTPVWGDASPHEAWWRSV
jgi:FHA domain-containing protein